MSRRPDHAPGRLARLRPVPRDEGFSLIEVTVAMLIFAVLAVSSLGFVLTSLSATALARTDTVAKNLNQELLESMRNLPYFVHVNVSTVPDLLDTYYTSTLSPASGPDGSGFVAAGAPRDTAKGDPATGPFFRRVLGDVPGYDGYSRRVTAQFVASGAAALANPSFVSTSTGSAGRPPGSTLGVRVTTLWTSGSEPRSLTVESQITDGAVKPPLVTLQARLSMLRFTGVLPDSRELVAEAGVLNLDGSLSTTAVGSAAVHAASATVASGGRVVGAAGTVAAPPTAALGVAPLGPQSLSEGGEVAAFSGTTVSGLSVSSDGGQPGVGSEAAPVTTVLTGSGVGSDYFRAGNRPAAGGRLGLLSGPVVRASAPACGGSCEALKATGSLVSTGGSEHTATATLGGSVTGTVALFPTSTSPEGVVRVKLSSLAATCVSEPDGSSPGSVTVDYSGTVSHRTYDPATGGYGYSAELPISSGAATDPLAGIDLLTVVGVDGAGVPLRLSDYVQTWSSLSSAAVTGSTLLADDGSTAGIGVPGVFTLTSQPLRSDPVSTVGLQLGALSCTAGDIR